MKRYTESFIKKVREIRKNEKTSYSQIGLKFKIPSSTIRNWCYDIRILRRDILTINNENKRQVLINSETFVVPKVNLITKSKAKFLAALLYGCEGFKYPASNFVGFANSDMNLIKAFYILLARAFTLDKKKLWIHLQIHTTHDYLKLKRTWSRFLGLPEKCFMKPTVTKPTGKKHRQNYLGTCTIRYKDYRIQLKLLGIFAKFTKQFIKIGGR